MLLPTASSILVSERKQGQVHSTGDMARNKNRNYSTPLAFPTESPKRHNDHKDSPQIQMRNRHEGQSQTHEDVHSFTSSRPRTESWTVIQSSRSNSAGGESFSGAQRPSTIYGLVERLDDVDLRQGSTTPGHSDLEGSATPPPVALYPRQHSNHLAQVLPASRSGHQNLSSSRPIIRDDVLHYKASSPGIFVESVNGVDLDAKLPPRETGGPETNIPEVEARDIRNIRTAEFVDDLAERHRHAARSPPPVMQRRPSDGPLRQILPKPVHSSATHHLVDRYSSYAGTRLGKQMLSRFESDSAGVAIKSSYQPSHGMANGIMPKAYPMHGEGSTHSSASSRYDTNSSNSQFLPSASRTGWPISSVGRQQRREIQSSDHSSALSDGHSSGGSHENLGSGISRSMQQKISESAVAIEQNLPWYKPKRFTDASSH